jgi:hypothetical protein
VTRLWCAGILVGGLLAIGIATPAEAAKPFNLGIGNQPGVAVGSHGEAHVAWKRELGGTNGDVLEYCRVAKGNEINGGNDTVRIVPVPRP